MTWVEIALASAVPIALIGALLNRALVKHEGTKTGYILRGRSMGWQFFSFLALAIGLPIVGLLALKGLVTGQAAIIFFAVAVGYTFGKIDKS